MAIEQGCRRRSRGPAGGHQMNESPGDQGRHRKKAEDNGRMPPEKGIQCGGAEEQEGVTRQGGRGTRPQGGGARKMQARGKRTEAERHVSGPADAVAAGSPAWGRCHTARRRSSQEGPGRQQVGA